MNDGERITLLHQARELESTGHAVLGDRLREEVTADSIRSPECARDDCHSRGVVVIREDRTGALWRFCRSHVHHAARPATDRVLGAKAP